MYSQVNLIWVTEKKINTEPRVAQNIPNRLRTPRHWQESVTCSGYSLKNVKYKIITEDSIWSEIWECIKYVYLSSTAVWEAHLLNDRNVDIFIELHHLFWKAIKEIYQQLL